MCLLHQWWITLLLYQLLVSWCYRLYTMTRRQYCISLCHSWDNFVLLCLIVDDLFLPCFSLELSSEHWVSCCSCDYDTVQSRPDYRNEQPNLHHCGICNAWVSFGNELALLSDLIVPAEHGSSWDTNVGQQKVTVLFGVVTNLRTYITCYNSGKGVVILVSNLHEECLDSTVLSLDYGLRVDQRPCGNKSQLSRPKLGCCYWWHIKDKLLGWLIISGRGF